MTSGFRLIFIFVVVLTVFIKFMLRKAVVHAYGH